ncbi:NUDIX domain-containing protein [Aureimonas jatrophae]|uniref:ADP-ribose pyrophosphatase n=1 Tax=Aureimonas jatrophae TaxID=1166073 RepID=A0A1H0LV24_9HYPH|nr:NUDIX domain-containing protein [Aureimonas jatrophae]MBB3952757.1 ADP-ribose pyrophosphatase [Aureimonas jatrophae]SDO71911.1 ADP-ribose pyrophosphatase [Aureimonas jatrophae]
MSLYRRRLEDQPLDFTITNEPRVFDGFRPVDGIEIRHERLAEGEPLEVRREVMRGGRAAVILPYDPALDALVLIRQFRIGAALATPHAAPLELPAGLVDDGEATQDSAARELREETGLEAQAVSELFSMLSSPGLTDERITFFLALVDASNLAGSAGLASEHEDILPLLAPVDALVEAADAGAIENGFLLCATHWFARHGRERARLLQDTLTTQGAE